MIYSIEQKILFKHCDPARIVFYPRYFEIINDTVESFFFEVLDYPFEELHKLGGVPTVNITTQFHAPSRHGDLLNIDLTVSRVGATSLTLALVMSCQGQQRLSTTLVLVNVDMQGKPKPWPDTVKEKATHYLKVSA